jgi:carbon monoxide dehydrogenase subunit G
MILPVTAQALWAEPSCDPADDPNGCNVSAPLNVSSVSQTKSGALTLTGVLTTNGGITINTVGLTANAAAQFNNNVTVSGTTSLGTLTVNGVSSTFNSQAIFNNNVTATSKFTYSGASGNFSLTADSIDDSEVNNNLTASIFRGSGSSTDAVDLGTAEVSGTLSSSSVTDVWVNTTGDTISSGTGLTIKPSSGIALTIQPTSSAEGISISGSSTLPLISLNAGGTSSNSKGLYVNLNATSAARAIDVVSASSDYPLYISGTGTATRSIYASNVANNGAAIYGTASGTTSSGVVGAGTYYGGYFTSNTNGLYSRGDGGYGAYVVATDTTGPAVWARLTNTGTTTSSKAVYGEGANGYGGYFTATGTSSSAIYAGNTGNGGKGIDISTSGIGINITTSSTTSTATGIVISASGGQKGIVISASSTGIDVNTSSGVAIEANDDSIHTTAGYRGGQFYPAGNNSTDLHANTDAELVDSISITSAPGLDAGGLVFDGSDVWVAGGAHSSVFGSVAVQRISAYNGQLSASYNPSSIPAGGWSPGAMIYATGKVFAFQENGTDTQYLSIDPYDDSASSITGNLSTSLAISSAVDDGENIWLGTSNRIYKLSGRVSLASVKSGIGQIVDMLYADGYIWALDHDNSRLYQLNQTSGLTVSTITVGSGPVDMEYDGAYIWVLNDTDRGLTRINAQDPTSKTTISLSSSLSGADAMTFDGIRLWLIDGQTMYGYNVANEEVDQTVALTSTGYTDAIFDGTYVWASDGYLVDKVDVGRGRGYAMPAYPRGIIMYGNDDNYHCLYFDSGGALNDSTSMTNCQ